MMEAADNQIKAFDGHGSGRRMEADTKKPALTGKLGMGRDIC